MLKAVLFDLDGTLLPMDEDKFTQGYFGMLCEKLAPFDYKSDELIKTIWAGSKAMIKNDGTRTNEQVFWDCFTNVYGEERLKDKVLFEDFYRNDFKQAKKFCGENKKARALIDFVKAQGLKVILASNPLFPRDGMINRLEYINLHENDFDYITSYETSHYCKPNPNYFQEILTNNHLQAGEVILFGNSVDEDCEPANKIGIKPYLVGESAVSKDKAPVYQSISFDEIKNMIQKELNQ